MLDQCRRRWADVVQMLSGYTNVLDLYLLGWNTHRVWETGAPLTSGHHEHTSFWQSLNSLHTSPFLAPAVTVGERRELWILPPFFFGLFFCL